MDLRTFLSEADRSGYLVRIREETDPYLEMARVIAQFDGRPVLFERVKGAGYRVAAGVCSDRRYFALALGTTPDRTMFRLAEALEKSKPLPEVGDAPSEWVVEPSADLEELPFLTHYAGDGGAYATAAVAFYNDPETGPNASYHRLMRVDRRRVAARLVERRGAENAWRKTEGDLPVAICIGLPLHVLLAASMAPPPGVDELAIAEALIPTPLVTCKNGVRVPADAEIVLEGRITKQLVDEGPFVDLTGTYDFVRPQPIIEIDRITHRSDPIYQALLPGRLEHRLLMGMPREPTIYSEVNKVVRCLNVHITPGGTSWLHAVVQIDKRAPDDGLRAIDAAFRGHGSLKHVVVVDDDVDLFKSDDVEWAIATRFQADRDLVVLNDQPSSSLDPSALHAAGQKSRTAKMGLDATIPWDTPSGPSAPHAFRRVG